MNKYSAYKDSGLKWIGVIPKHWQIEKGKWLFEKKEREVRSSDEVITCFRDGQVTLRSNRRTDGFTNSLKEIGYQGIRKGDLVIHAMDAFAGAIGISDSDGKATPVYSVCRELDENIANPFYYAYLLRNFAANGVIKSLAKGIRERSTDFRFNDFGILQMVLPPIKEQNEIVNFLDSKLAKIDQAIAQKEKLIELLKERKQIMIQNAVTKGLDPEVKMKDSGVDEVGNIPIHWQVKKLKFFCDAYGRIGFRGYTTTDLVEEGEGAITISPSNISEERMNFDKCSYLSWKKYEESPEIKIQNDDLLMVKTGSSFGKVGLVRNLPQEATINPQLVVLKNISINNEFLYYAISSQPFQIQINKTVIGSTIPTISENKLLNLKTVLPPNNEIDLILNFCRKIRDKFESAIKLQQNQIERLKEFRDILIDNSVTGKFKVS